jgi:hypothetical protein
MSPTLLPCTGGFFARGFGTGLLISALFLVGCALGESDEAWRLRRDALFERVSQDPLGERRGATTLVKMSLSPRVSGNENNVHGRVLQGLRSVYGEGWDGILEEAGSRARETALILLEAIDEGVGFRNNPDFVMIEREVNEDSRGSISLDLGIP